MKKITMLQALITAIFFVFLLGTSCKKDNTNSRPVAGSFNWTIDGVTFAADEATAFTNDIEARKTVGTDVKHVEVAIHSLNNFPVGNYTLGVGADVIGCWDESDPSGTGHFSSSGTLHITASSADEVSGDFTVMLNNGSVMTGNFSHVPAE